MNRYIEKDKVISVVCDGCNEQFSDEPCEPSECSIMQAINSIPTAEVVEVIRCRDCKYFKRIQDGYGECPFASNTKDDGYCLHGERIEQ